MPNKRQYPDIRIFLSPKQMKTEEDPSPGMDTTYPRAGDRGHAFRFRYKFTKYDVTCDSSMTVLEALLTNPIFKRFYKTEKGKEMVIRKEASPRGAVSTDFPCCRIAKNELLNINFIRSEGNCTTEKKPETKCSSVISPDNVVVFNVKTTGGKNIKRLMKNHELRNEVDYVGVYAFTGETVKKALRRDGRFNGVIFKKNCALQDLSSETITAMSNVADPDCLEGKSFQVIVQDNEPASQSSSQEMEMMEPEAPGSTKPQSETTDQNCQDSAEALRTPQATAGEETSRTRPKLQVQDIPNTEEVLKLLRDQFGALLEQLKKREGLTKPAEVRKFFREEFDKSAQSFSELKKVRQLVALSDSVCLIRVGDIPRGTGFLLFDRFVLTNAHVVENDFDQETRRLRIPVTARFGYEGLGEGKEVQLKADVVAIHKEENERGQHLDFALLELSDDAESPDCTELLKIYSPPPTRGGVCIIGHPGCGVKKMDPCFIIPKLDVPKAADEHVAKNIEFFHVMKQQSLEFNWKLNYSQIYYNSCFFHGSSGSPVFNDHSKLIGVHTGGYSYKGEWKTQSVMEYSYPMLPILESIIRQCKLKGRSDIAKYVEDVLQVTNQQI